MGSFVTVLDEGGKKWQAYLAEPAAWNGATLIVLGEVFNVNHWVRAVADRYAALGYEVIAPDLYWRDSPETYLDYTDEGRTKGRALHAALDIDLSIKDIGWLVEWARKRRGASHKVGLLGFCLGGRLIYLAAARTGVDAAVGYYPVQLEKHLDDGPKIKAPTLLLFGERDHRTPPELIETVRQAVAGRDVEIQVYSNADHGFGRFGEESFHEESAALAGARVLRFFDALLVPTRSN